MVFAGVAAAEHGATGGMGKSAAIACDFVDRMVRRGQCAAAVLRRFFSATAEAHFARLASESQGTSEGKSSGEEMVACARAMLGSVQNLLQLVLEYVGLPSGAEFAEERAIATIRMMSYFQHTEQGAYFRYVHTLYREHMCAEPPSHVEAGATLLLHARQLPWTDAMLPEQPADAGTGAGAGAGAGALPAERSWQRRQRLYTMAVACFDQAQLPEAGLALLRELAAVHRARGDPAAMAAALAQQAAAYDRLAAADARVLPPFFLIAYAGAGFPLSVANRRFVQRGDPGDTAETVLARLRRKFPAAQMQTAASGQSLARLIEAAAAASATGVTGAAAAAATAGASTGIVAILPLQPSSEAEAAGLAPLFPPAMPAATRRYTLFANTRVFAEADGAGGARSFFVTEEPLPGTRRSVEVVRTVTRAETPAVREVAWLTAQLNDAELRVLAAERGPTTSATASTDLAQWAGATLATLAQHVRETTVPRFVGTVEAKKDGDDDDNEAALRARVRLLLARLCAVVRRLVVAHSRGAPTPAHLAAHTRLCDQAAEFLHLATLPPSSSSSSSS